MLPMPISTAYDQHYHCETCNREQLDPHRDLDVRTWTCRTCRGPVRIELDDGAGNTALVVRLQAQHLRTGHLVYMENDLGQPHAVLTSEMAYKGGKWHLRLQGFGVRNVEPGYYFNCLPTP
ncbi:hypothetical protein GR140_31685 (plasmid) [Pseudomonas putida]|uniref:hypothetical protein n=1 Tax=Pseudomonas putida TaxID=303 RepID=UPI001BB02E71|nr:hypothetical protein [Pseudomonas putida]QUG93306.1 hypothetical protein GR140_31685 [Pseudomonas putida]